MLCRLVKKLKIRIAPLKIGKTPGVNHIKPEMTKHVGEESITVIILYRIIKPACTQLATELQKRELCQLQ